MYVVKRNGQSVARDDAKFERQIDWSCQGLLVEADLLKAKAREMLHDGMQTKDLHRAITKAAADLISESSPDWTYVAARCVLQDLYKVANNGNIEYPSLESYLKKGEASGKLTKLATHFDLSRLQTAVDTALKNDSDLHFDYLGIQTLADRYLLRDEEGKIIELPQHMFMRVAMGIALGESIFDALDTRERLTDFAISLFQVLTTRRGCPSTPTLFNSATRHPQLSSCFGSYMDDSLDGIFSTLAECGAYSKFAGGCSVHLGAIRSQGSYISSTGGKAGGPIPYAVMYDATLRGFDQSGKRKGVGAMYLDVWHADAFDFLRMKEPGRDPRLSAFDTFPAFMIPDVFMTRVLDGEDWSLFDPKDVPKLHTTYGSEFTSAYISYEQQGLAKQVVPAETLWHEILTKTFQHGVYWPCFRDTLNSRYPQRRSGLIHNSNLCTEIALRNDPELSFVCNLASINLAQHEFVFDEQTRTLEWNTDLQKTVEVMVRALDNVITVGTVPNKRGLEFQNQDRAIGLGVMGWAVALAKLGIDYEHEYHVQFANEVYKQISATAIHTSATIARERGSYRKFHESDWKKGVLPVDTLKWTRAQKVLVQQFGLDMNLKGCPFAPNGWEDLRDMVKKGMRNSCLMAIAPTATIANIMGTTQCTEMPWDLISRKENLSGEFTVVSPVVQANKFGLKLKAARDINHRWTVYAAAVRQFWIDQSQSTNFFLNPVALKAQYGDGYLSQVGQILDELYVMCWELGVKTTYYVYSQAPDVSAIIASSPGPVKEFDSATEGQACFLRPGDPGFEDCEACQ